MSVAAYSLAMELAASGRSDWDVLATDISAAAVGRGDPLAAVAAFRRADAAGLAALERCDRSAVEAELDGWAAAELAAVLRTKLGRTADEVRS